MAASDGYRFARLSSTFMVVHTFQFQRDAYIQAGSSEISNTQLVISPAFLNCTYCSQEADPL